MITQTQVNIGPMPRPVKLDDSTGWISFALVAVLVAFVGARIRRRN